MLPARQLVPRMLLKTALLLLSQSQQLQQQGGGGEKGAIFLPPLSALLPVPPGLRAVLAGQVDLSGCS